MMVWETENFKLVSTPDFDRLGKLGFLADAGMIQGISQPYRSHSQNADFQSIEGG